MPHLPEEDAARGSSVAFGTEVSPQHEGGHAEGLV